MTVDLETGLLRAFVTAVHAGSISRAAVSLGHTQPALSQRLRRLERAVGHPLLHRTAAGVTMTKAGEALLPYAERIITLSAQALASTTKALTGHCGVGLLEDLAAARLPQLLADFAHVHPRATVELMIAPGAAMGEALAAGRIDVALCEAADLPGPPCWTVRLPLVWVVGSGVDPGADPLPLVLFSRPCRWRTELLAALDAVGRRWRIAFESTSLPGVHAALRAGLGVAALLPATVEPDLTVAGPEHALPALPGVEVGLARRPGTGGDALVDAVADALRRLV